MFLGIVMTVPESDALSVDDWISEYIRNGYPTKSVV
jgi:hypothetical protein